MTLEQEIRLAAKHAAQAAAKEAAAHEKLENAKNIKAAGVSVEIISKCTGLSLQQVREL